MIEDINIEGLGCICLTCGIRNDHTNPTGYCRNDHDDWLELRDIINYNEHYERALKLTGVSDIEFEKLFLDPSVKFIRIIS